MPVLRQSTRTPYRSLGIQIRPVAHSARMALGKVTTNVLRVLAVLVFIAAILVATLVFHVQDHLGDIIQWIEDNKVVGSLSFVGLYALFTGQSAPSSLHSMYACMLAQCVYSTGKACCSAACARNAFTAREKHAAVLPVPASVHEPGCGGHFSAFCWAPCSSSQAPSLGRLGPSLSAGVMLWLLLPSMKQQCRNCRRFRYKRAFGRAGCCCASGVSSLTKRYDVWQVCGCMHANSSAAVWMEVFVKELYQDQQQCQ